VNWLTSHASAIQAFASIATLIVTATLAWLTGRYVRVTKRIADSALEQVEHFKLASHAARQQAALALDALSKRIRVPLTSLNPRTVAHRHLFEYGLLSLGDITDLESLARQVNQDAIRYAGKAAVSLHRVLALIEQAKAVNLSTGWIPTDKQVEEWRTAMDAAPKMLAALEAACLVVAAANDRLNGK